MQIREFGAGPTVVLLHGFLAASDHLEPLARELSRSWRVLLPDMPGYGGTPRPESCALDVVQGEIEDALISAGISDVALVGCSVGGYRALSIALANRVHVTHVIALGGMATLPTDAREGQRQMAAGLRGGVDLVAIVVEKLFSPGYAATHPEVVPMVERWLRTTPVEVLAAEAEAIADMRDLRPMLARLEVPVLARVGDADVATPPDWSREITAGTPKAPLEIVPGAGHLLAIEDLAGTSAAIERLLRM
jgi:3-oxoadipate enol-lactonase